MIESGKLSLSREPVSLIDVMRECQAMTEPQAQQRDIHINFLPFDNTWFAYADRTRVKQALINLISNAIKYNCQHETVEVKCTLSTPERIRISVKDSGAGLPPEKLAQLFQPFNRLGQETGTEEGTGIGLVVTKQLVELMGGINRRGKHCRSGQRILDRTDPGLLRHNLPPAMQCRRNLHRKLRKTQRCALCSMWKTIRPT